MDKINQLIITTPMHIQAAFFMYVLLVGIVYWGCRNNHAPLLAAIFISLLSPAIIPLVLLWAAWETR